MARIKVGEQFDSYAEDFFPELQLYEKQKFFNHRISKSILDENNPGIRYKSATLHCKRHGNHQKTTEQRKTQTFTCNCPYFINIRQKKRNGVLVLEITDMDDSHNHDLSESLFKHMPKQRKAVINDQFEYIENVLKTKPNYRALHKQINNNNSSNGVVVLKDLYNAKAKVEAKEDRHENDLVQLVEEMMRIDDAVVKVITNAQNELDSIFFQDARMKKYFDMYPDVVMFDGTYKLNNRRMPLVILLVIDGNGESQIAGLFIVRSENEQTFRYLFEEFKKENEKHDKIEIIMSDKSFANRNAFRAAFPNAKHQLCIFHVLQIFNREVTTTQ